MTTLAALLFKRSLQEDLQKRAFIPLDKKSQQALGPDNAPVDPAAAPPGGAPMDPTAPPAPMDPSAGGASSDPAAAAGAPPVDPAAAGALPPPPTDPAAGMPADPAAGAPPVDPMADPSAAAPTDPTTGEPLATEPDNMSSSPSDAVTRGEAGIVMDIVERTLEAVGKKKTPGAPGAPGAAGGPAGMPPPPGPITGMPGDMSAMAGPMAGVSGVTGAPKTAAILSRVKTAADPDDGQDYELARYALWRHEHAKQPKKGGMATYTRDDMKADKDIGVFHKWKADATKTAAILGRSVKKG